MENNNQLNEQFDHLEDSQMNHETITEQPYSQDQEHDPSPSSKKSFRYAGFWMRFWAYLLDLLVIGSIERLLINPVFRWLDISLTEYNMFAPISITSAIIFYLYFVLMTKYFQQTLGKMVFGLRVVNFHSEELTWGTVLFREWIGRFISATVVLGYVITAFMPKKQGLHDLFTDTTVVHVE
ncbi:RDD family protein [Neobacillus thermocopriae]|uniref:RDD family protein n=1 Tax=Neobacillus thermocopriae TaxID=1215031 RepID=A0A6B3TQG6_9BACI|nr:RDD family protein [Neobacillus thermocopriae]MED3622747.1 RDD family protein [Neobacillus thermocopriae]MED3714183.1 RDD family protein [Neobacillus thermocopriae]NEX78590.1 RDD family protein [Neobacillus thermocopriae]